MKIILSTNYKCQFLNEFDTNTSYDNRLDLLIINFIMFSAFNFKIIVFNYLKNLSCFICQITYFINQFSLSHFVDLYYLQDMREVSEL